MSSRAAAEWLDHDLGWLRYSSSQDRELILFPGGDDDDDGYKYGGFVFRNPAAERDAMKGARGE